MVDWNRAIYAYCMWYYKVKIYYGHFCLFRSDITVQFEEPVYSVMEGGELSLRVQIFGENEIPLTVSFTISGSAECEDKNDVLVIH